MRGRTGIESIGMAGAALALFSVAPASAKNEKPPRPEVFQKLVDCRAITDNAARLACYDSQVAKLDEAESKKELVVVDKAEVKKARKGLFGLSLPDLGGLLGGGDAKDGEGDDGSLTEIQSTLKAASTTRDGKWVFIIEDGARWVQTDTASIRTPKPGMAIRIRKAAMGSFFANINDRPAIRVRREN